MSSQVPILPLGSASPSLSTLPVHLRRKIYKKLGIVSDQKIYICASCDYLSIHRPCEVFKLMITSRFFYDEISTIVYANNHFILLVELSTDLRFLQNLRPQTVARLRRLSIEVKLQGHRGIRSEQVPFLHEWLNTLGHLSLHIEPKMLNFSLEYAMVDATIATLMTRPFRKHYPTLASCSINFPYSQCGSLNRLMELTVLRATRYERPSSTPFRFLNLPLEIRFAVLRYTDLVTHDKEVYWNERDGFFIMITINSQHSVLNQRLRKNCACSETDESRSLHSYVSGLRWNKTRCVHPAYYDATSIRCHSTLHIDQDIPKWAQRRWRSPLSFFLVCRSMRNEAEIVFWQENRFILTPSHNYHILTSDTLGGFGLPKFMAILRPSALRALRMLEIVMPPVHHEYCPFDDDELEDWFTAFDTLRRRRAGNLANLTLRIYITEVKWNAQREPYGYVSTGLVSDEEYTMQIERIKLTLRPLSEFGNLNHFFLHLSPRSRPRSQLSYMPLFNILGATVKQPQALARNSALELQIGEWLMGKHDYARCSSGENTFHESQWCKLWAVNYP